MADLAVKSLDRVSVICLLQGRIEISNLAFQYLHNCIASTTNSPLPPPLSLIYIYIYMYMCVFLTIKNRVKTHDCELHVSNLQPSLYSFTYHKGKIWHGKFLYFWPRVKYTFHPTLYPKLRWRTGGLKFFFPKKYLPRPSLYIYKREMERDRARKKSEQERERERERERDICLK